jgi:hypothetical protein
MTNDTVSGFAIIMAADCRWFHWSVAYVSEWSTPRDLVTTRTVKKSASKKSMVTLTCRRHGLLIFDNLSKLSKINSQ